MYQLSIKVLRKQFGFMEIRRARQHFLQLLTMLKAAVKIVEDIEAACDI